MYVPPADGDTLYPVSGWNRPTVIETVPADQEIWFLSDLHLGDGTRSDVFFGKDHHLVALLGNVEKRGALLVVVGDAMDFHQAWTFTRILRAHQELLGAMSRLGRAGRLVYVVGNHDHDIGLYRQLLHFRVCDELHVGDRILVQHGYQYDPYIGPRLEGSHVATKVHHLIERYLDTWIRIPLGEFYTFENRLSFWVTHKLAIGMHAWARTLSWVGFTRSLDAVERELNYWARSNMGDPMCIFRPIERRLADDRWPIILCGHSHLPGIVRFPNQRTYVNTGSWSFASSHYVTWDGTDFVCKDWITGRQFREEFYGPVLDGSLDEKDFWMWWQENYMGFLRFREGEERRGRLRGWESYIRDYQYLAQLAPAVPPLERAAIETGLVDDTADPNIGALASRGSHEAGNTPVPPPERETARDAR
jgi:UDP-2,3-diacylglucosamine pyrophosphatase LpxH